MKKRISLILAIVMIAAVFATAIPFAALADDAPAAAQATDVVLKAYTSDTDDAATRTEVAAIKLEELVSKLGSTATADVVAAALAGKYIWLEFENKTINLGKPGTASLNFFVAEGKKTYVNGNGAVLTFENSGNGTPAIYAKAIKTGTEIADATLATGEFIFKDLTVNTATDICVQTLDCAASLVNSTFVSSAHNGLNISGSKATDTVKITLDDTSVLQGNNGILIAAKNTVELSGSGTVKSAGFAATSTNDYQWRAAVKINKLDATLTVAGNIKLVADEYGISGRGSNNVNDIKIKDSASVTGGTASVNLLEADTLKVEGGTLTGDIAATDNATKVELLAGSLTGEINCPDAILTKDAAFVVNDPAAETTTEAEETTTEEVTTTDGGETTTTDGGNDETTTTEKQDDETTPSATTTDGGEDKPSVTTPDATTPPAADEGCAGCGGIAIAAQLVALICAAAVVIIKKK